MKSTRSSKSIRHLVTIRHHPDGKYGVVALQWGSFWVPAQTLMAQAPGCLQGAPPALPGPNLPSRKTCAPVFVWVVCVACLCGLCVCCLAVVMPTGTDANWDKQAHTLVLPPLCDFFLGRKPPYLASNLASCSFSISAALLGGGCVVCTQKKGEKCLYDDGKESGPARWRTRSGT